MGIILASAIIDDAEKALYDETNIRYSEPELLGYLNDGQRAVVSLKPDAYILLTSFQLDAGAVKQSLPAGSVELLDIVCNMGLDGDTRGKAITQGDLQQINAAFPDWPADNASSVVQEYFRIPDDNLNFYVYPKQPASNPGYVEASRYATPPDVASGDAISLNDIYKEALYNYIMGRAHAKEIPEASKVKSDSYFSAAANLLAAKEATETS